MVSSSITTRSLPRHAAGCLFTLICLVFLLSNGHSSTSSSSSSSSSLLLSVSAVNFPLNTTNGYAQPVLTLGDASAGPIFARVESPASLVGLFVHAMAPFTGSMFVNMSCVEGEDCRQRFTIHLPNTWNDSSATNAYGCTLLNLTSDAGEVFDKNTMIMASRDGPCGFADKALTVQNAGLGGVLHQGTGALTMTLGKLNVSSVPSPYIQNADGARFRTYLQNHYKRKNGIGNMSVIYEEPLVISFSATGPLGMVPEEKAAFKQVAQTILDTGGFNDAYLAATNSALRSWADAVKYDMDPCLNRMVGLWCENGHLTLIWISSPQYITGVLDAAIGSFPQLRLIELSGHNIKSVPDTVCNLSKLTTFSLATQSDGTSTAGVLQGLQTVPDCLGNIPALLSVNLANNRITNVPSTLMSNVNGLQFITMKSNALTALHSNFSTNFRNTILIDFSMNQISTPLPSFKNWPYMNSITMSRNLFTSVPNDTSYLDGLLLSNLDLSFNRLTILPDMVNTKNAPAGWSTLQFQNNMFQGGIPKNWGLPGQLPTITTIRLANNQLTGPFDAFGNMVRPTLIQLSNNSIVFDGDVGQWLSFWIPATTTQLEIDNNRISGFWSNGWLFRNKAMVTLNMANNQMNSLPIDIFANRIVNWDFTNNNLTGSFPTTGVAPTLATTLNLLGNPNLMLWPLPSWLTQVGDPLQGGGVIRDNSYACPTIKHPTLATFIINVEPTFTLYHGCVCIRGKFGYPPLCQPVPERAEISPIYGFSSPEVGSDYLKMINTTSSLPAPPVVANSTNSTNLSSSGKGWVNLNPSTNNISTNFEDITYPPGFSDQFYGSQRLTLGISTTFEINIRNLFLDTQHSDSGKEGNATNIVELYDDMSGNRTYKDGSTITGEERYQPVRTITIQLHISRALFKSASDVLFVYEGDASLSGTRVADIVGTDYLPDPPTATSGDSSSITLTPTYLAKYSKQMSAIQDRALVEVRVMNNAAALHFSSRASEGQFFFATYTYSYTCHPDGEYFLDDTNGVYKCIPQLPTYEVTSEIRIAVWVVAAVCLLWILINLLAVIAKYDSPLYRAASRPFLLLMLVFLSMMALGSMLYAAIPDMGDDNSNRDTAKAVCIGRAWLLCFPLAGILAILFGRANRVEQIFGSMSILKVKSVTDMSVIQYIVAFCGIETVLLLIFSFMPLSQPKFARGQGGLYDHMVISCSMESGGNAWIGVQIAFFAILLCMTTFIGFKTRNLPSAFNESHHIMNCVLFLMFFSALIVPIDFYISELPNAAVLLQGLGQAFLVALMTTIFFAPKLYVVMTMSEKMQRNMMTLTMSHGGGPSNDGSGLGSGSRATGQSSSGQNNGSSQGKTVIGGTAKNSTGSTGSTGGVSASASPRAADGSSPQRGSVHHQFRQSPHAAARGMSPSIMVRIPSNDDRLHTHASATSSPRVGEERRTSLASPSVPSGGVEMIQMVPMSPSGNDGDVIASSGEEGQVVLGNHPDAAASSNVGNNSASSSSNGADVASSSQDPGAESRRATMQPAAQENQNVTITIEKSTDDSPQLAAASSSTAQDPSAMDHPM